MIGLDSYDKKILEILLKKSREQVTTISKKVGLRRENVNYKINRLIRNGIIKEPITFFNEEALSLSRHVAFVELINLRKMSEEKILGYLKDGGHISWIGINAGKWSLIFDIITKDKEELNDWVQKFLGKFGEIIGDYVLIQSKEVSYFPEKMLKLSTEKHNLGNKAKVKIDKIDMKILSALNESAWNNYVKMGEIVGLTPNSINNRIKNLEKEKVIEKYTISLDWKKLGWELYGLQLKTIKFENEVNDKIVSYCRNNNRVIFYYQYLGGVWDYDLGVIVKNSEELREFINNFRHTFSDSVKISDVSIILREVTGYKLPANIFQ